MLFLNVLYFLKLNPDLKVMKSHSRGVQFSVREVYASYRRRFCTYVPVSYLKVCESQEKRRHHGGIGDDPFGQCVSSGADCSGGGENDGGNIILSTDLELENDMSRALDSYLATGTIDVESLSVPLVAIFK